MKLFSRSVKAPAGATRSVAPGWDRQSYLPKPGSPALPAAEALARGRALFEITPAKAKAEAQQAGRFFDAHPSVGASQVSLFHGYFAQNETFKTNPLQAYLYSLTRPVDEKGEPKNALWQAYAQAIETGRPEEAVEAAFLRAHLAEFKILAKNEKFRQLYALATPEYRQVVEAYFDTLSHLEAELDAGKSAISLSRGLFLDTNRCLLKRGVTGFALTKVGLKSLSDTHDPLTRDVWSAAATIGKAMVLHSSPEAPAISRVTLQLSAAEAAALRRETGIPFEAGRHDLSPEMLKNATFAEPERRAHPKGPARRYPLRMEDFAAPQKVHAGQGLAGADGVMSADEVRGVLRDVQVRVRSNLVDAFFSRYPVPEAGILIYSKNMLALNATYSQTEMFGTLGNAIMPVDNDGKPKNALWQAYADGYEQYKKTGAPSMEALESLWFKAHMADFAVVDTPEFQRQLQAFWADAAKDPALAPMVTYTRAMVGGRVEFEKVAKEHATEESAFASGLKHFATTVARSGSFPFWRQDLHAGYAYLRDPQAPAFDDRGLPTDKLLFERAVQGLSQMRGLRHIVARSVGQVVKGETHRKPIEGPLVDLGSVLTPAQLRQVDPKVLAFYRDPSRYDIEAGVDFPDGFSHMMLGGLGSALSGLGDIPNRKKGFENYPLESEIYQDAEGRNHWDRYVVVDGERRSLFRAQFGSEGRQIKEVFNVAGREIALYFDVVPYQGGIRLTMDRQKSSAFATGSSIYFTTVPSGDSIATTGHYRGADELVTGSVGFVSRPHKGKPRPALRPPRLGAPRP